MWTHGTLTTDNGQTILTKIIHSYDEGSYDTDLERQADTTFWASTAGRELYEACRAYEMFSDCKVTNGSLIELKRDINMDDGSLTTRVSSACVGEMKRRQKRDLVVAVVRGNGGTVAASDH
jgi:hypothetical protein